MILSEWHRRSRRRSRIIQRAFIGGPILSSSSVTRQFPMRAAPKAPCPERCLSLDPLPLIITVYHERHINSVSRVHASRRLLCRRCKVDWNQIMARNYPPRVDKKNGDGDDINCLLSATLIAPFTASRIECLSVTFIYNQAIASAHH